MDYPPDYSKYTWAELLVAKAHINREKYPQNAQRLDDEISRRRREPAAGDFSPEEKSVDSVKLQPLDLQKHAQELPLAFHGSTREYFRIWIVNLCLTLLTLGIFSAWAKVRKKRFSYSHTTLGGTPFQYLAQPIPILKGRLIAGFGFLVYYLSSHFFTSLYPWILGAGLIAAPWVIVRSTAFNARYSAFRNMTFHFDAGYMDALKILYVWGLIPILVFGMIFDWKEKSIFLGFVTLVFVLHFPWWIRRLKKFIVENTFYGGKKGNFSATGGQYFKIYLISALIILALLIPMSFFLTRIFSLSEEMWFFTYVFPIVMYAGYVVAYAYIRARSGNLVWNSTHLGPLRFESTLRCRDLVRLYVTNAIGIVASLGMLIPWAVIRTWKYRADNLKVWQQGPLAQFQGTDKSNVAATGAETLDIFDVDLSI